MIINNEECEPFKYNKNYFVSKSGKIYSTYVIGGNGAVDTSRPHMLKYGIDKDGYFRVVMSLNGVKRYIKAHTVIVTQYIGDIAYPNVVNHIDGNKRNNNLSNLEITSVKENTIHAHRHGLCSNDVKVDVLYNGKLYKFNSLKECSDRFPDLSRHYLDDLRNKRFKYSMFLFKKKDNFSRITDIEAYYNGKLHSTFSSLKAVDIAFGKAIGTSSGALKNNDYRYRVNQYTVMFPTKCIDYRKHN